MVPVAFKDVTEDGKLVVGDVFLETTLNNIRANGGKIAISAYDAQSLEGYQIKGTAEYVTEGAVVDTFKAMVEKMFNGAATAKGALIITPYVLVHPAYHGQGIAGHMLELIKEKYRDFLYIEAMPEDKKNVPFYEKHGFSVMEKGAAIQIWHDLEPENEGGPEQSDDRIGERE